MLADFATRRGVTFPLLSDAGSAVIKQYGIFNTTVSATNPTYGIPFPGTFIVDAKGVVTSRFFESAYQERDTITSVLVKLGAKLDVAAAKITAPHLTLTAYATDRDAAPGTHCSLVVDVAPGSRVHVYAPGVTGYTPIALTIDPQPALANRTGITITGTLTYQACDDKVCFTPQSVPLSWTIGLKPLDRERVKRPEP